MRFTRSTASSHEKLLNEDEGKSGKTFWSTVVRQG
jgi:hypothetical protein